MEVGVVAIAIAIAITITLLYPSGLAESEGLYCKVEVLVQYLRHRDTWACVWTFEFGSLAKSSTDLSPCKQKKWCRNHLLGNEALNTANPPLM